LSNGDLHNFHATASVIPNKLLDQERKTTAKPRVRSMSLGRQVDNSLVRTMSNEASTSTVHSVKTNRLALEKSPYLLQHATNPVDWYPWGQEAFDRAKKENKLIFLSVGYSTCHW
jgi:hypothetical protein